MTLSGSNAQRPLLRGLGVSECDTSGVKVGIGEGGAVCVQVCVWDGGKGWGVTGGGGGGVCCRGRLSMVLTPPEWSYCQDPVHLLPWQQQWPRCCHGKVDTKRRGVGTGPGVRSEGRGGQGSQPAGQHTRGGQGEKRRRESLVFLSWSTSGH